MYNIWHSFKLFHFIINFILTRKQQQLVHNQFFASTFQPYSWVLPRSLWRLELCGRLASTLIEIIGMFWRELLPLPSILSGKRSKKKMRLKMRKWYQGTMKNTWYTYLKYFYKFTFLLILKVQHRIFLKWLWDICSTVNTWPYFLERVFSGQNDGYDCKWE